MRKGKVALSILCLIVGFLSCNKDDEGSTSTVELRDRGEQQVIDIAVLVDYLESHYYNSEDFVGNPAPSLSDLIITKLEDGASIPTGHTMLIDKVGTPKTAIYDNTDYEFYVLDLNPRVDANDGGASPTFADNVLVSYEGFTLDDHEVFDSAVNPVEFDLLSLIPGWRKALPAFKTAESFVENGDGTVSFINYGLGVMFLPSGLAYFGGGASGISTYESIAFKFELFQKTENDHDNDGIPSYLEDLNGDGEFTAEDPDDDDTVTHDDTDSDNIPNYFDPDDDGDGVLTINEDIDGDGDPTNDIGANGIPKYLDDKETESKS